MHENLEVMAVGEALTKVDGGQQQGISLQILDEQISESEGCFFCFLWMMQPMYATRNHQGSCCRAVLRLGHTLYSSAALFQNSLPHELPRKGSSQRPLWPSHTLPPATLCSTSCVPAPVLRGAGARSPFS